MKKEVINLNYSLNISDQTTFDMFENSSLYSGQIDNRFFWLEDLYEIDGLSGKFKVGLCFRNNLIVRVELYCIVENGNSELEKIQNDKIVLDELKENYKLKCKDMESSFDKRNNYSSIIINF